MVDFTTSLNERIEALDTFYYESFERPFLNDRVIFVAVPKVAYEVSCMVQSYRTGTQATVGVMDELQIGAPHEITEFLQSLVKAEQEKMIKPVEEVDFISDEEDKKTMQQVIATLHGKIKALKMENRALKRIINDFKDFKSEDIE